MLFLGVLDLFKATAAVAGVEIFPSGNISSEIQPADKFPIPGNLALPSGGETTAGRGLRLKSHFRPASSGNAVGQSEVHRYPSCRPCDAHP